MRIFIQLCCLLLFLAFQGITAQEDFIPITPENAHLLELGYILPGFGCNLSPDGIFIVAEDSVYQVRTGEVILSINQYRINHFSPDSTMFATEQGIYDTQTWKLIFPISEQAILFSMAFSPDSRLVAIEGHGLYETATWTKRFALPEGLGGIEFSPNGTWVSVGLNVYETQTGKPVFSRPHISGGINFSPDETMIAVWGGVFDTATWQKRFHLSGYGAFSPDSRLVVGEWEGVLETATGEPAAPQGEYTAGGGTFSPDSTMIAFGTDEWTVKNTFTGETLFTFMGSAPIFSSDNKLLATTSGLYHTSDGEHLIEFPYSDNLPGAFIQFSSENTLLTLASPSYGGAKFCALYGLSGSPWPYRSGLVRVENQGIQAVYATTPDRVWLRISDELWVIADEVEIITLPEGIPKENP